MDKHAAGLAILEHALAHVPFEGWSEGALARGAEEAGYRRVDVLRVFPRGPLDALLLFAAHTDAQMLAAYAALSPAPAKIRERIATLVKARLDALEPYREAERRAVAACVLPAFAPHGVSALARTVDAMWKTAGGHSADFNWYTKRALLAGVYSSTLLVWLNDRSAGHEVTWDFLHRRIADVMKIQGWKKRLSEFVIPVKAGI